MRLMTFGMLAVVAVAALAGDAAFEVPEHAIPPGYKPEVARDERGIWRELEDFEKELERSPLRITDPALNDYIDDLVCRVAQGYCGDFRLYVVRNPHFNASMAANGMMVIWTGLLTRVASTDELAAVVGHEIAHYTRLHTLARFRKIRKGMTVGTIFSFGLGIATGVLMPIGEMVAIASALKFSREQESEADLLGAKLIADVDLDPHAAYRIWRNLIEEDQRAEVKREEPGLFTQTHPDPVDRAEVLEQFASATYGPPPEAARDEVFLAVLANNYKWLMDDQIRTARYGRTEYLLERHAALGVPEGLVHYFRGVMLAQRAGAGDLAAARTAYEQAAAAPEPVAEAFRNLGYAFMKDGDVERAREHFGEYLARAPGATDKAMIEFYLQEQ